MTSTIVGEGDFRYEAVPGWGQLPEGWSFVEVPGVAVDSRGRVYAFNRGEHPVIVLDQGGRFIEAWGEGEFTRPHGIWIGPDDVLYLTDDQDHTVRKYTPDGARQTTLGASGSPSDTGMEGFDYRAIKRSGPPFHFPTNVALSAAGEMYISDGYGNARVHRFSADGELLVSWGEPGSAPGQFNLPHGIVVDGAGRVLVADRENSRVQIFSPGGEFIAEWTDVVRPCQVFVDSEDNVFVAELGSRVGLFPWMTSEPGAIGGRVSIFDKEGNLRARWGGGEDAAAPGEFLAPHDIWVDAEGDLYVSEVTWSAAGKRGLAPPGCPSLRKFLRLR